MMKLVKQAHQLHESIQRLRRQGKQIGFVPTMGFLHEGHLSLIRRARRENDVVVVSIFVNPTQFGPREDLKRYPRDLPRDQELLKKESIDYLFVPSVSEIYPRGFSEWIEAGPLGEGLCGAKRPGHFRGVATVVNRLLQITCPHVVYLGQKDFQQARIIQEMIRRLKWSVKVRICGIVREPDGLAMSSRNRYLSTQERILARSLHESLMEGRRLVARGERRATKVIQAVRKILIHRVSKIDYCVVVDSKTLKPVSRVDAGSLIVIACWIGRTRLIDNILIRR